MSRTKKKQSSLGVFVIVFAVTSAAAQESVRQALAAEPAPKASIVWPDVAPPDCPFPKSEESRGVEFTGRHARYANADTWYPSWASDGHMYSGFTDGEVQGVISLSGGPAQPQDPAWVTGNARIEGDDPLNLKIVALGTHQSLAWPYGGRYPCGSLVFNGVWYYGTYCLDWHKDPWDTLGPFVGFRMSRDGGKTWTETPCTPENPLFGEAVKVFPPGAPTLTPTSPILSTHGIEKVKMGSPHVVDFGQNMRHSPDGKMYLLGHGATRPEAACHWISGDQVYLARVTPSPENINDIRKYEFFASHDGNGEPIWVEDFSKIKPLLEWNDRLGCVTATWNPGLKRFLLCVTDGGTSGTGAFDTMILESEKITGPWRRVVRMEKFGTQAYFVNIPSKFISGDGRTMWLCYAANYTGQAANPPGSGYSMCLQEIRLLPADATNKTSPR
jgi:hypothetical protein